MNPTCINYDRNARVVFIHEYASGRGAKWSGKPIYMIPCSCGYPLKLMFAGAMPEIIRKCEFNGFNHKESCAVHELKKPAAWGIQLKEKHCPACEAAVSIGPNLLIAAEKFIRKHVATNTYHYNSNKIRISPHARRAIEAMPRFKTITIVRETITGRDDYAIVWRTGNEKFEYGKKDYNTWYDARQAETKALADAFGMNDEEPEQEADPFDFSDEIMSQHGEDCTCNLCLK